MIRSIRRSETISAKATIARRICSCTCMGASARPPVTQSARAMDSEGRRKTTQGAVFSNATAGVDVVDVGGATDLAVFAAVYYFARVSMWKVSGGYIREVEGSGHVQLPSHLPRSGWTGPQFESVAI